MTDLSSRIEAAREREQAQLADQQADRRREARARRALLRAETSALPVAGRVLHRATQLAATGALDGTGAFGVEVYRERSSLAAVVISIRDDGSLIVKRECVAGGKVMRCRSAMALVRAVGPERVARIDTALATLGV